MAKRKGDRPTAKEWNELNNRANQRPKNAKVTPLGWDLPTEKNPNGKLTDRMLVEITGYSTDKKKFKAKRFFRANNSLSTAEFEVAVFVVTKTNKGDINTEEDLSTVIFLPPLVVGSRIYVNRRDGEWIAEPYLTMYCDE